MKETISLLLFLILLGCNRTEYKFDYLFSDIEDKYNIKVHHHYSDDFIPKSWTKPPISGIGEQIDTKEVKRMPTIIDSFLTKYSENFITENLSHIYLLKKMHFYGKNYGGTCHYSSIYIANNHKTENILLGTMHSEFSSILLKNHKDKFPFQKWKSINDSNFKYIGRGVDMLGQDNLDEQNEYLLSQGFIVRYGISSLENDFNMFVDWMFTHPEDIKKLAIKHKRIRDKYEIVLQFYSDINARVVLE